MEDASSFLRDQSLASDYAKSIKEEFGSSASKAPLMQSSKPAAPRRQTIKAGPNARIVIDRPVTREERNALQDIGRVIAHLLTK